LQASLVRLGSWMPFAHAAGELGRLTGAVVSESLAARLTEAAGAAYVAEQTAAVERLERQPTPEPAGPGLLQLSADGAMISLVGRQWVEVKTLALGRVVRAADGTVRTREVSYFSRRAEHTAFRRLALVETHRRGVGTALAVVAVVDGADWLQRLIDFHRPDAIRAIALLFPFPFWAVPGSTYMVTRAWSRPVRATMIQLHRSRRENRRQRARNRPHGNSSPHVMQ
jgi:hypothetical protein